MSLNRGLIVWGKLQVQQRGYLFCVNVGPKFKHLLRRYAAPVTNNLHIRQRIVKRMIDH